MIPSCDQIPTPNYWPHPETNPPIPGSDPSALPRAAGSWSGSGRARNGPERIVRDDEIPSVFATLALSAFPQPLFHAPGYIRTGFAVPRPAFFLTFTRGPCTSRACLRARASRGTASPIGSALRQRSPYAQPPPRRYAQPQYQQSPYAPAAALRGTAVPTTTLLARFALSAARISRARPLRP